MVAIASVLVFHLLPGVLPGGFVGVDVFFVISGFVVTRSLADKEFGSVWDLLSYFYVRRILRIIPALLVMLIVSVAVFIAIIPGSWMSQASPDTAKGAFLGISNIVLALQTDTYFAPAPAFNPFTHTWSLGVEEQFYLVFPFLLFWHSHGRRIGKKDRTAALATLGVLTVASLVLCWWLTRVRWSFAFYLMPARFWELGIGMLLCLTLGSWRPRVAALGRRAGIALSILAVALLASVFPVTASTSFPFPLAMLPIAATVIAIGLCCAMPDATMTRILAHPLSVGIGKRSYSLYLWHWPVFVFLRWTTGLDSIAPMAAALVITFLAAEASYRFVELGEARGRIARTVPRRAVITAGLMTVAACGVTARTALHHQRDLTFSQTAKPVWYPVRQLTASSNCSVQRARTPFAGGELRIDKPTNCRQGQQSSRLFVVGDSHSLAYTPILQQFAADTGREVRSYHLTLCPYANMRIPLEWDRCGTYYAALNRELMTKAQPGDVLFLASLKMKRFRQPGELGGDNGLDRKIDVRAAAQDLLSVSQSLNKRGVRVVVEGPKPLFRSPPFRCADWFDRRNPVCKAGFLIARSELDGDRQPVISAMYAVAKAAPNVTVWDPFPLLCPQTVCNAFSGTMPLFVDGDHLSEFANQVLYPDFRRTMDRTFAAGAKLTAASPAAAGETERPVKSSRPS